MDAAAYIMIGGFLGAGKTTAIKKLAERLHERGLKVGLITNDQSVDLVDTRTLAAGGFPVEEITGGCFCCRFNSLIDASNKLTEQNRPEVFLAEPVGSCTDLRATVSLPMQRIYGDRYRVAPLSVLIDPLRARAVLGLEPGRKFSKKVLYVYEKQLQEAERIIINKIDLFADRPDGAAQLAELEAVLAERYPQARIYKIAARSAENLEAWLDDILEAGARRDGVPEIDYDIYAEGEALLGWFNGRFRVSAAAPYDGNEFLLDLARGLHAALEAEGLEVAHCKMTLSPEELGGDLAVVNLVRGDGQAEASHKLYDELTRGELLLNMRAEGEAAKIKDLALKALEAAALKFSATIDLLHSEHFQPARPVPTWRLAAVDDSN